ncbi:MAG: tetratricopeptide repeat protein [Deltaproteobacteria bacterium]|nr:tetratricopeptide repeat protein [Deltaproteobacteria bacterium]
MTRHTLRTLLATATTAVICAAGPTFAADGEYLPGIKDQAQDHFRAGLASALRPLPKCNPYRILDDGNCCPQGFVSRGNKCSRIAPPTCAQVAIDNPEACALTLCAKYVREVEEQKKDKDGNPVPRKDEQGKVIEGEFEMTKKEVACEPWKDGMRDLDCELDTYQCTKEELASGPTRWCGDWIKRIEVPAADDPEAKPVERFIRCQPGSENCDLVTRECTGQELTSNKSSGAGPCKIGEYIDESNGKCTAYTCPKACTTQDGRCAACGPDYQGAAQSFSAARNADPNFYEAYFNEGMALERLGKHDAAVAVYQKAREVAPKTEQERLQQLSAQAYIARAKLAEAMRLAEAGESGKAKQLRDAARSICESIRGQDPDNTMANNVLAQYWLDSGNLELAENFVRQVLRVNREDTVALNIRALINLHGKNDEIVRWILEEKVLILDPANAEAFANLGLAYVRLGDMPRAVIAFERAVKLRPNAVPARLNLGAIYMEYLNYKASHDQYKAALALEKDNLEALTGYALALEGLRKPKEAAEIYERVIAKDGNRSAILVRLAVIYEKAPFNDGKKAISYWKRFQQKSNLPPQAAAQAEREAAKAAYEAHLKKRTPRKGKEEFMAEREALREKAESATLLWKNVVAIQSRIDAIEQGMQLEKEARDGEKKEPSS